MYAQALSTPGRRVVYLRAQLPLIAKDAAKAWVNFTIDGDYEGHADGAFSFNRQVNSDIIKNFNEQKNAVPLTYEHPRYDDGQPKPAAGWVHELKWKDGGLWGLCEFTKRSADMIRAGEYRFTSVVVDFDSTNRVTGKPCGAELFAVALTNTPFIDGQKPIALSRRGERRLSKMGDIDIKAVLKALGLDANASPEQAVEVLGHAMALMAAQEGKAEEPAPEPMPVEESAMSAALGVTMPDPMAGNQAGGAPAMLADAPAAGPEQSAGEAQLAQLLQSITGKDLPAIIAAIQDNKDAVAQWFGASVANGVPGAGMEAADFEDPVNDGRQPMSRDIELSALRGTVKSLAARVDAYEKAEQETKAKHALSVAESKVNAAIESGRIAESDRTKWVSLATSAPAQFDDVISTLVPAVPTQMITTRASGAGSFATDDDADLMKAYDVQLRAVVKDPAERKTIALNAIKARRKSAANGRA